MSDLGCSAVLARAALETSYLKVLVNTRSCTDDGEALLIELKAEALLQEFIPLAQCLADYATEAIRRINNG